jgi:hypothetical protein
MDGMDPAAASKACAAASALATSSAATTPGMAIRTALWTACITRFPPPDDPRGK